MRIKNVSEVSHRYPLPGNRYISWAPGEEKNVAEVVGLDLLRHHPNKMHRVTDEPEPEHHHIEDHPTEDHHEDEEPEDHHEDEEEEKPRRRPARRSEQA